MAWPKVWPRFSSRRAPVSNSSSQTRSRLTDTLRTMISSRCSVQSARRICSKSASSASTPYLMISPAPSASSAGGSARMTDTSVSTSDG